MHTINLMRHALSIALLISLFAGSSHATVFTVDTTSDSITDTGSLRYAITNLAAGTNTIQFDIPTADPGYNATAGAWTIQPATDLPDIAEQVTINGYSFVGAVYNTSATPNTLAQGDNAKLSIIINGSNYTVGDANTTGHGLHFVAGSDNSIVRGLVINQWIFTGILVDTTDANISGIQIVGNFVGTDYSGTIVQANTAGIALTSPGDFDPIGTIIGTPAFADRNIIAGSLTTTSTNPLDVRGGCIYSYFGISTTIQNNYVGTDITGTQALGDSLIGMYLRYDTGDLIGGPDASMRNIVSGHLIDGMSLTALSNSTVQNNYVGTDITGTQALGNSFCGIALEGPVTLSGTAGSLFINNLVSGNGKGIRLGDNQSPGCTLNTFQNNKIGTDYSGTKALPNERFGMEVCDGENTVTNNLISGNGGGGLLIYSNVGTLTSVTNNLIGTDITGTKAIPNNGNGVQIGLNGNLAGASNNTIGA